MEDNIKKIIVDIQNIDYESIYKSINDFISKNPEQNSLVVVTGPTVSGKTDLSIEIAKHFDTEIISADSRQIYQRMDIGTNKIQGFVEVCHYGVPAIVYENVLLYMLNIKDPGEDFSVSDFVKEGRKLIHKIWGTGRIPMIVGGTGYYIKNLIYNKVFPEYEVSEEIHEKVEGMSKDERIEFLKQNDPVMLKHLEIENLRRLQNPIEYFLSRGKKYSDIYFENPLPAYRTLIIRLDAPKELLYKNADKKLDYRLELGMVNEVRKLISSGVDKEWLKKIGLEYKYITMYLNEELTYDEMKEQLGFAIHHYIKRQITYMQKYL